MREANGLMDGIINIYKEQGVTSHHVVARARFILKTKKIGHAGTLDPLATGVLPICIGKGTKAVEFLTEGTKTYLASFLLGITTDTEDITGTVIEERPVTVTKEQVKEVLESFVGVIEQVPPMYSAIKKDGKKLYELARAGITIEREPRKIQIFEITLCENLALQENEYQIRVVCQKGTYIRTLCAGIGETLQVGATMTTLCREKNGMFSKDNAVTLDELEKLAHENRVGEVLIPVAEVFTQYPALYLDEKQSKMVRDGLVLTLSRVADSEKADTEVRVFDSRGSFLMLARADRGDDQLTMLKAFY